MLFFVLILLCSCFHASAQVQVDSTKLFRILVRDTVDTSGPRIVRGGFPLPRTSNVLDERQIQILRKQAAGDSYEEIAADVWPFTRIGGAPNDTSKPIWWVGIVFHIDSLASGSANEYFLHYGVGRSTPSEVLTVSTSANDFTIDSPTHTFKISRIGGHMIDEVKVKSVSGNSIVPLSSSASNGVYAKDVDGTVYSTANDANPTVTVEEQGDIHVVVRFETWLKRVGQPADEYLRVTCRLMFFVGDGEMWSDCKIANPGPIEMSVNGNHKRFKDLWLELHLDLGTGARDVQLSEFADRKSMAAGAAASYTFKMYSDYTATNFDFDAQTSGTDATKEDITDNFFLAIREQSNIFYNVGNKQLKLGEEGSRSNGVFGFGSPAQHFMTSSQNWWEKSPQAIAVTGGNVVRIHFLAEDDTGQSLLVHNRGPLIRRKSSSTDYSLYYYGNPPIDTTLAHPGDLNGYILHSGVLDVRRVQLRFSAGALPATSALSDIGRLFQERSMPWAADPAHYRKSHAFGNRLSFMETLDWATEFSSWPNWMQTTATQVQRWGQCAWNESACTPDFPCCHYWGTITLLNRLRGAQVAAGAFGYGGYGRYFSAIPWGDGFLHTAYGNLRSVVNAALSAGQPRAFTDLWGLIEQDSLRALYIWKDPGDYGGSYAAYEKGCIYYGKSTWRHSRFIGGQWAALILADETMREHLVRKGVTLTGGYPYDPNYTGNQGSQLTPGNLISHLYGGNFQIAVGLGNVAGLYVLTGDPTYVTISNLWADGFLNFAFACRNRWVKDIFTFPHTNDLTCSDIEASFPGGWSQTFMHSYVVENLVDVAEINYHLNLAIPDNQTDVSVNPSFRPL